MGVRQLLAISLLFVLLQVAACSRPDTSAKYPSRPIEVIVPFAPGGGSDTFARILKAEVEEQGMLPQPLVIINAPGAGGTVGSRRVMNESPDGYTVLLLHDGIMTAKRSGKTLYGPEAFEQVAGTGSTGTVVAVHESSPYSNLTELLTAAADQPKTLTFATNLGAPSHFVGLMLEQAHGDAKFRFAQSGGGADRFAALKGLHASVTAFSLEEYLRFQSDGVKALAYLGDQRHRELPDVATAREQGFEVEHSIMQYWWMPKGSPAARREYVAAVLNKAMGSERFQQKLSSMKIDPVYLAGEPLAAHLADVQRSLAQVDPGTESPLPNAAFVLAGLTSMLGLALVVSHFRSRPVPDSKFVKTNDTGRPTWWLAAVATALLVLYALATIVWEMPLGVSTTIFVLCFGILLAWRDGEFERPVALFAIVVTAFVLGGLFHVVFTEVFEIGL